MGVKVVYKPARFAIKLQNGIPETMKKAAAYLRSSANRKIKVGVSPPNSPLTKRVKQGDKPLVDTNSMAASIAPHSGSLWADASTTKRQAKMLQRGGTIKPKNAKALWIPAGPMTRTLMKRYGSQSPRALINAMKADNYSFFFTPLSKVYMAKKGKQGKPFALFIVRSSVRIPARPFLFIDSQDEDYLVQLVRGGILKELGKSDGSN